MKKMNKKGFTLIELLAVIIILGILMIIAIPSVTTYIQNSRKSAFVDTSSAYIDAVRTKVNEGKDLKLFATNTLYLIPVGNDATKSCVSIESGGKSPFSETWDYAYVGVVYNGTGYDYYFVGQDGAKQGVAFVDDDVLNKDGTDLLYSSTKESTDDGITIKVKGADKNHKISSSLISALTSAYSGTANLSSKTLQSGSTDTYELNITTDDKTQFMSIASGLTSDMEVITVGATGNNSCQK